MVRNARLLQLASLGACLSLTMFVGCGDSDTTPNAEGETSGDGDGDPTTSGPTTDPSTSETGDGDGDPTGDGDGDTTNGDGDGDPTGDGDGDTTSGDGDGDTTSGDGDGDTTGDGDGDGDTTGGDGDGDIGDGDGDIGDGDGDIGDGDGDIGDGDGDGMEGEDDGGFINFVPDDDFGDPNECDPWLQDCPEGDKCVPYASNGGSWDANKCVQIMGDGQVGDACTYDGVVEATDTCDAGSMCWNLDDNDIGTCTAFCTGTPNDPMCDPGHACSITNNGSITLCLPTCDPLLQDCAEDLGCYWAFNAFLCVFTTQNIPTGEPCGFLNDCAPGNYCTAAESLPNCNGGACCANYCDLDDGNGDCFIQGTECVPFYEPNEAPPGEEDIGICMLPA